MAKSQKQKRWARGTLAQAVTKVLRSPKTVLQVAKEVGADRSSVFKALRVVGKPTGKTLQGPKGPPAALFRRA